MSGHNENRIDPRLNTLGYEPEEIKLKPFGVMSIWFYVAFGLCGGASWVILYVMAPGYLPILPGMDTGQTARVKHKPGLEQPLLQSNISAKSDIVDMRRHETEVLNGYGEDEKTKSVHIPIEKAISIAATEGVAGGNPWPAKGATK